MIQTVTRKELEFMLQQEGETLKTMIPLVNELIRKNKLPLKVVDNKLVDVGDSTEAWLSRFVSNDPDIIRMKEDVKKLAVIEEDKDQLFCVMINGPTGTGKEIIALALHGDRLGSFVPINCAGLPSELIESELFGHVAGAFTGATKTKDGLMRTASKGTLFLDEIGELPLQAQAKLLRAIQSKTIRKVGADKDEQVNCRIVCATHRDLRKMAYEQETFRLDLYARISTFELVISGLKERHGDVVPICESIEGGKEFLDALLKSRTLSQIDLSLNVRSLQQQIKRYKILGKLPE